MIAPSSHNGGCKPVTLSYVRTKFPPHRTNLSTFEARIFPSYSHFTSETGPLGPCYDMHEGGELQLAERPLCPSFQASLPPATFSSCNNNNVKEEPRRFYQGRGGTPGEGLFCQQRSQSSSKHLLSPASPGCRACLMRFHSVLFLMVSSVMSLQRFPLWKTKSPFSLPSNTSHFTPGNVFG